MASMQIELDGSKMEYQPGATLSGTASWQLDQPAESLEVRLIWFTSGKGTRDVEIVNTERIVPVPASGSHRFAFPLPEGPYSFAGKLVSLSWAVELIAAPSGDSERMSPIIVSPTRKEILLQRR